MSKITVYIPCYNYGRYIDAAIESVLKQTLDDWELIVINDGSIDNTMDVLSKYKHNKNIRIIDQENKGLNVTNNIALRLSNGKYIMRLDADDFLDENALHVMSSTLDSKPEVGLVYPDYYHVNENGDIVEIVRREKIEEEVQILDLPAHGACTMFRKEVLLQIGGYTEEFSCQDGYELWLRFIQKYTPYNINIPLFYYRQHDASLTKDVERILETRRKIKRNFVKRRLNGNIPKVLGIIPAARQSVYAQKDPFAELADKPLIWYTLNEVVHSKSLDRIVLSSEDDEVLEYCNNFKGVEALKRESKWANTSVKMKDLIIHVLDRLKEMDGYEPDAVCTIYINTPLRRYYHIDKAIDTMAIFEVDSVISVQEELANCFFHRKFGLEPINPEQSSFRIERNAIYKENSAVYLSDVNVIRNGQLIGKKVGHITMLPQEGIKINSKYDIWMAEQIIKHWNKSHS